MGNEPLFTFKSRSMELFYASPQLQPELRGVVTEFVGFSARNKLPPPIISDLQRPRQANTLIYFEKYKRLREAAITGETSKLSLKDQEKAKWCRSKSDAELLAEAEHQFSWHCVGCGIDFSGNPYTSQQREQINAHFEGLYKRELWEYMLHKEVGPVPHFHIGRRDFDHRRRVQLIRDLSV